MKKLRLLLILVVVGILTGCRINGTVMNNDAPVTGLVVVAQSGTTVTEYAVTDENGYYEMEVSSRSVTVKPLGCAYTFSPASQSINFSSGSDIKTVDFSVTSQIPFLPSTHGFKFANGWEIPFINPGKMQFPDRENIPVEDNYLDFAVAMNPPGTNMGLCGGMASLAYDFYRAGISTDGITDTPYPSEFFPLEDALYNAIWYRLFDSWGGDLLFDFYDNYMADEINGYINPDNYNPDHTDIERMLFWMAEDSLENPGGVYEQSKSELDDIMAYLDRGHLVDVYLMCFYDSSKGWDFDYLSGFGRNHQVLAYDYEIMSDSCVSLHIYDTKRPGKDNLRIVISFDDTGNISGLRGSGGLVDDTEFLVYGFFVGKHVLEAKIPSETIIKGLAN